MRIGVESERDKRVFIYKIGGGNISSRFFVTHITVSLHKSAILHGKGGENMRGVENPLMQALQAAKKQKITGSQTDTNTAPNLGKKGNGGKGGCQ